MAHIARAPCTATRGAWTAVQPSPREVHMVNTMPRPPRPPIPPTSCTTIQSEAPILPLRSLHTRTRRWFGLLRLRLQQPPLLRLLHASRRAEPSALRPTTARSAPAARRTPHPAARAVPSARLASECSRGGTDATPAPLMRDHRTCPPLQPPHSHAHTATCQLASWCRCTRCAPLKHHKAGHYTPPFVMHAGKCVACAPTSSHAAYCEACSPQVPSHCTRCSPQDSAKKPLYASKHGVCTVCTAAHCAACDSAGRCTKCVHGKKMRKGGKCA